MTGSRHVQTAPRKPRTWAFAAASMFCLAGLMPAGAQAVPMTQPPAFRDEISYLTFTIDHHYSALRMTELAAGTATVGSSSNYAGSPNVFPSTPAKATDPVALNVAVMANMVQRQEIIKAQGFLQSYYGISYTPSSEPYLAPAVALVDQAVAGDPFNIAFLKVFSGHHAMVIPFFQECTAAAAHADVQAYCAGIVASQTRQIGEMRNELATAYGITSVSYETVPLPAGIPAFSVPEPASAAIVLAGLLGLGVAVRWARASGGSVQRSALSVR